MKTGTTTKSETCHIVETKRLADWKCISDQKWYRVRLQEIDLLVFLDDQDERIENRSTMTTHSNGLLQCLNWKPNPILASFPQLILVPVYGYWNRNRKPIMHLGVIKNFKLKYKHGIIQFHCVFDVLWIDACARMHEYAVH